jgi:hypothetical protein
MTFPKPFSWDRYGSKGEIDGIYKELQRRNLNGQTDFQYQGFREIFLLRHDKNYGKVQVGKKIHSDFSWTLPIASQHVDKEYPLTTIHFLFVSLDGEEAHKGQQTDRDFENDQFIKDQGSISLRYSYRGQLSETRCREIVDEIEQAMKEVECSSLQPPALGG